MKISEDTNFKTDINAGTFQEYDYTCEDAECEWKQITEYWRK